VTTEQVVWISCACVLISVVLMCVTTAIIWSLKGRLKESLSELLDCAQTHLSGINSATTTLSQAAQSLLPVVDHTSTVIDRAQKLCDNAAKQMTDARDFLDLHADRLRNETLELRQSVTMVKAVMEGGFAELRSRAFNDQLTRYPRRIELVTENGGNAKYLSLERGYELRWEHNVVRFRLVCESPVCLWKGGRYKSECQYELDADTRVESRYLPRKESIETWLKAADVTGLTPSLEDHFKVLVQSFRPALAVKLGIQVSTFAHPVFALSLIVLEEGFEQWVARVRQNARDREANQNLWRLICSQPYEIKDLGGPCHVQFGELIRHQEINNERHIHKSFGGLTKWLDPQTKMFDWVCPDDAYDRIARLHAGQC
jgi:hypothetical protein